MTKLTSCFLSGSWPFCFVDNSVIVFDNADRRSRKACLSAGGNSCSQPSTCSLWTCFNEEYTAITARWDLYVRNTATTWRYYWTISSLFSWTRGLTSATARRSGDFTSPHSRAGGQFQPCRCYVLSAAKDQLWSKNAYFRGVHTIDIFFGRVEEKSVERKGKKNARGGQNEERRGDAGRERHWCNLGR